MDIGEQLTLEENLRASIKTGCMMESELIDKFASEQTMSTYYRLGRFNSSKSKEVVLAEASRYCRITYLDSKRYRIDEVYPYVIPKSFYTKLNSKLYKFIIPLLLDLLLKNNSCNENPFVGPLTYLAENIGLVNKNYRYVKYNISHVAGKIISCSEYDITSFYGKCDGYIKYYLKNSLEYMQKCGCINVKQGYRVRLYRTKHQNGVQYKEITDRLATDTEISQYNKIIKELDKKLCIMNESERFCSVKSTTYQNLLKRRLRELGIRYVYLVYEISYICRPKCEFILSLFKIRHIDTLHIKLSTEFRNKMKENTKQRYRESKDSFPNARNQTEAIRIYMKIFDAVVETDSKKIKNII